MASTGKNAIFVSQSGFAFGAIVTSASDAKMELQIPTPTEVDFDGLVTVRVGDHQFRGSVTASEHVAPCWHITFEMASLSQLVGI